MAVTHTAGGVVLNKKGQVLVVNQNRNSWSLPKGHIEPGENPKEAAEREILEEAGVSKLEFIKDLGVYERFKIALNGGDDPSELKVIHLFLFRSLQEKLSPIDPRNPEAKWVDPLEVASLLTHPKDKDFFLKVLPQFDKMKL